MSVQFNADEVLAIAARIERNGESFYRRAAELAVHPEVKQLLGELAEMESSHESLFLTLRQLLTAEERAHPRHDPYGQSAARAMDIADRSVFHVAEVTFALTGYESTAEVLDLATAFERDSIAFFEALTPLIGDRLGRAKVEVLIDEERDHLARLLRTRENLERAASEGNAAHEEVVDGER